MSDLSAADVMALASNDGWQNNPFIYLVWLALLGNGGIWGNRNSDAATQGAITRADMFEGFNNQDVNSQLRELNSNLNNGLYSVNSNICGSANSINSNIADSRFATQQGLCDVRSSIKDVIADNYKNTCEITNAIHSEGEATRALITQNTIQDLRDRLEEKDRELMTARFQISQQAQNNYLIQSVRPFPQPAYITTSPYTSSNTCSCN